MLESIQFQTPLGQSSIHRCRQQNCDFRKYPRKNRRVSETNPASDTVVLTYFSNFSPYTAEEIRVISMGARRVEFCSQRFVWERGSDSYGRVAVICMGGWHQAPYSARGHLVRRSPPAAPRAASSPGSDLYGRAAVICMAGVPAVICMGGTQCFVWEARSDSARPCEPLRTPQNW